jgi:hypothetical protein
MWPFIGTWLTAGPRFDALAMFPNACPRSVRNSNLHKLSIQNMHYLPLVVGLRAEEGHRIEVFESVEDVALGRIPSGGEVWSALFYL